MMVVADLLAAVVALGLTGNISEGDVRHMVEAQLPRMLGADSLRWSLAYPWAAWRVPAGATDIRLSRPPGDPRPGMVSCEIEVLRDGVILRASAVALRCAR